MNSLLTRVAGCGLRASRLARPVPGINRSVRYQSNQETEKPYEELAAEVEDLTDKYKRALAETENVRRREQKKTEDAKSFAVQGFCKDLLEVADSVDLAINAVKPEELESNSSVKNLHDGVVMMKTVLLKTFEKHGLKPISPEGEKFDPNLHEAVFQVPKDQSKYEAGHVGVVMKIGYSLNDRPIRPAQVGVVQQ